MLFESIAADNAVWSRVWERIIHQYSSVWNCRKKETILNIEHCSPMRNASEHICTGGTVLIRVLLLELQIGMGVGEVELGLYSGIFYDGKESWCSISARCSSCTQSCTKHTLKKHLRGRFLPTIIEPNDTHGKSSFSRVFVDWCMVVYDCDTGSSQWFHAILQLIASK